MKRLIILLFSIIILFTFSFAGSKNDSLSVGFNLGPSIGFGDVFKEYSESYSPYFSYSFQNKLGIHFGFDLTYSLNENISIQALIDFQSVSNDWKWEYFWYSGSGSEKWRITKIFVNGIYNFNFNRDSSIKPFVFAGLGLAHFGGYAFEQIEEASKSYFGINLGGGVKYPLMEMLDFVGFIVFNDIFSEENATTYFGIHLGFQYRFELR
ncbi:MAG: outer membrane beta-barrel protein [Candidatus Aminicenantia bacterium]